MKKGFGIFLLFISFYAIGQDTTCIYRFSKYYNLDAKMLRAWRSDTNGCKKERSMYARDLENNKLLIGIPKKLFFHFFGTPERITNEGICIYYMNSDCDKTKKKLPEGDNMNLIILFNDDKLISIETQIFD